MKLLKPGKMVIALCAFFMLCGALAAAAPSAPDPAHRRPGHFLNIINFLLELDLTAEQKNDLAAIFSDTRDALSPLLEAMHEKRSAMDELFLAEEIDTSTAGSQIEEISRLKAQISRTSLTALLQAAQVLTPEQRRTILDARDKWQNCFMRIRDMMLSVFGDGSVK